MFTLVFWFGVTTSMSSVAIVNGFSSKENCIHFAGVMESERRLQLIDTKYSKNYYDFTFICEEVK